jgi:hypothetical protein
MSGVGHDVAEAHENAVGRIAALLGGIVRLRAVGWGQHFDFDAARLAALSVALFRQIVSEIRVTAVGRAVEGDRRAHGGALW